MVQQFENVMMGFARLAADAFGGLERPAADEDSQSAQRRPFGLLEQHWAILRKRGWGCAVATFDLHWRGEQTPFFPQGASSAKAKSPARGAPPSVSPRPPPP